MRYMIVRIPDHYAGTVADLEAEMRWHFQKPVAAVEVPPELAERARQISDLSEEYERTGSSFDLVIADEARSECAEDLWHLFEELVPNVEVGS